MHRVVEDHAKRRLTDPVDIAKAILAMSAKGVPADHLLPELMKIFYIDLDQFNEVISGTTTKKRDSGSGNVAA